MDGMWKAFSSHKLVLVSAGLLFVAGLTLWLANPDAFPLAGPFTEAKPSGTTAEVDSEPTTSAAERIARLQRSIDQQKKDLQKLTAQLQEQTGEYNEAEKKFQSIDSERDTARQAIQDLKAAGKTAEALARATALPELEKHWQEKRDAFNLAIQEHKTLQQSIAAAQRRLQEDQAALARRTGSSTATASSAAAPAANKGTPPAASPAGTETTKSSPSATAPSLVGLPGAPFPQPSPAATSSRATAANSADAHPAENVSREVERAREEAKAKEEAAKKAENRAQSLTERINVLNENIDLAKKLLDTTRKEAAHEQQTKAELETELQQKRAANAPAAELEKLSRGIAAAQQNFQKELSEIHSATDRLDELQTDRNRLQAAQIRALHDAEAKKQAAEAADEKIAQLQNPFRPRNIAQWLLHHGPALILVAAGMFILHRLSRVLGRRLVQLVAKGGSKRGTHQDRENRAETLTGVFHSALSLLILGGGSLMILQEAGIPIVPLMGGAAVIGLAVAFGAQNLIKDYFSGFMVLLEDQYGINDVVKIGSISGLVEHISLRTTVLRDLEGVVHFIPHGTITTVSNQTHGWSRALFDVGIDYKEDVDRVMEVLLELGRELRREPAFAPLILDDPEMLGVDNLADSSVILKFFVKTKPLQQWTVKREMLKRIKKRFDELHIEIPYPHQTVHHRYDTPPPAGLPDVPPFGRAA